MTAHFYIINNTISNNTQTALRIRNSFNNTIENNTIESNGVYGMQIDGTAENNTVSENRICSNGIDVACTLDQIYGTTNYCSIANVCGGSCSGC